MTLKRFRPEKRADIARRKPPHVNPANPHVSAANAKDVRNELKRSVSRTTRANDLSLLPARERSRAASVAALVHGDAPIALLLTKNVREIAGSSLALLRLQGER